MHSFINYILVLSVKIFLYSRIWIPTIRFSVSISNSNHFIWYNTLIIYNYTYTYEINFIVCKDFHSQISKIIPNCHI